MMKIALLILIEVDLGEGREIERSNIEIRLITVWETFS